MRLVIPLFAVALLACHDGSTSAAPSTAPSAPGAAVTAAASTPAPLDATPPPSVTPFAPIRVTGTDAAMGTHISLAAYTSPSADEAAVRKAFDVCVSEIRRIESLMTTWRPDAELSKVNAAAGKAPVSVSQETFDIVKESVHASELSEGAFDITFESLHGLWKFDQDLDPHPPTDAQIRAKLPLVGYRHIHLDETARTI